MVYVIQVLLTACSQLYTNS